MFKRRNISIQLQQQHLEKFRETVQDILQPEHDDDFLLRWLKARDFDIAKAERMIRESFKFRKKMGSDTILTPGAYELPEIYKKFPITACLGFDKEYSVVRLIMAGLCDCKGYVYSLKIEDIMKILIYFLEHDLKMTQDIKKEVGKVDEKATYILDFTGFNLKQFYDRSVINAGIQLIHMYQDNYPEILKTAYLINVPSYFNWLFSIFKPFLNSVTLSKIRVFRGDEWKEDFFKLIDKKQVPAFLGGDLADPGENPEVEALVTSNVKIPESYYLKQNRQRNREHESTFEVPVDVEEDGSILKWVFHTKDYSIKFGLFYRHANKQLEELIPVESVDCQLHPEQNEFICERAGTYILHFNNPYNWLALKHLWYKVDVEAPKTVRNN